MTMETVLEFLLPSWWEVQVTVFAAAFIVLSCWFFTLDGDDIVEYRTRVDGSGIVSSVTKLEDDPAYRVSGFEVSRMYSQFIYIYIFLSLIQKEFKLYTLSI